VIDDAAIQTFEVEGVVVVRGLLDMRWIESLRDAMPAILEHSYDPLARSRLRQPEGRTAQVVQSDGMWRDCEPFRDFLFESPIGPAAAEILRSGSVRLYEDLLLYREAGRENGAPGWHRDAPYWPVKGRQLANVWFSLETVTADTGAVRIVAGSHLDGDDVARATVSLDSEPDPTRTITFDAEPGDVVVFHPRALHSGYGSAPDRPRRTFTIRFMGDDIRWRERQAFFHEWMRDCGLHDGDPIDHPGFPVVWSAPVSRRSQQPEG
jgi:ectoine hydroxylase-related dioxygenase (phytanoyl-CoA dioxygenase family)